MEDTQRSQTVSTKLWEITKQAHDYPERVFTTLIHHVDVEFLEVAFRKLNWKSAPGADGVTAEDYAADLENNLRGLHKRLKEQRYKAPPVKRVWLDKDDGRKRPIGMTELEDKIAQRAVEMIMSAVYSQDFHDFSHGFRRKHNQHTALFELREQCNKLNIGWIVDADVSGFFDNLDHGILRDIIKQRINDGGLLRLVGKWLKAGVLDEGVVSYPEKGTPQGGVISPLLANIYLHTVLDDWFVKEVKPRMNGRCFLIRYADDFVIGCEYEGDARRILRVLRKRFARFGLSLHPEKTTLIRFRKPGDKETKSGTGNGTFNFLGFTHFWARTRRGYWVIKRKTKRKKMRQFMHEIWVWCKDHLHYNIWEQHTKLCEKLRGWYEYYGIRGNYKCLEVVYEHTERAWKRWLSRRSHKGKVTWEKFEQMRKIMPLPKPKIYHNF